MVSYKVKKINNIHNVVETTTNHIIKAFDDFSVAKAFCRTLNSGYSFDGWTPEFFLSEPKKVCEEN